MGGSTTWMGGCVRLPTTHALSPLQTGVLSCDDNVLVALERRVRDCHRRNQLVSRQSRPPPLASLANPRAAQHGWTRRYTRPPHHYPPADDSAPHPPATLHLPAAGSDSLPPRSALADHRPSPTNGF